ncbi:hypothetical protein BM221_010266 [Beauveria bassiana]|uniref:Altered inheritance of mitochondria protein 11 n=1 Tax=Beauveria bassiana TaxID=176275 RepID=A0A2N6N935_BEABA|nr:hypothetical protein BM221_010266 [Beauveria bassiana]
MGFLAKLLAPHVAGTPPPPSPSADTTTPSSSSSSSSSSLSPQSPAAAATAAAIRSSTPAPPEIDTSSTAHLSPLQRQAKQLSLLLLGASFLSASALITRRAVLRRQAEFVPRFFHYSHLAPGSVDSAARSSLAAQALGLATLNVAAFGVLLVGGTAWGFDLCSVAELQARTRMAVRRTGGSGVLQEEEEREVDRMVMGLMERLGMDVEEMKEKGGGGTEGRVEETPKV